ncbi:hypothetical protein CLAIMM_14390 [Cladophialophora immunda]|nr:hypothetical protein CLAIMM_14390 [Cladophialophora immunda]
MADPISLSSGLLALIVFALQSSRTLYQEIRGFQNQAKVVRELKEELEALDGVLQTLHDTINTDSIDLTMLELPLLQCGKACKEFQGLVAKLTRSSNEAKPSWRDWAKLKYMGDDITGFKDMLAGYKSTITIALGGANIRAMAVTSQVLTDYNQLIGRTTYDLQEHLQKIDENLHLLCSQRIQTSDEENSERQRMQEEKESAEQCLKVCAEVSAHINNFHFTNLQVAHQPAHLERTLSTHLDGLSATQFTTDGLHRCKDTLGGTMSKLEKHINEIERRLQASNTDSKTKQTTEQTRIMEEINSIKQCLNICSNAAEQTAQTRINVFEDVSMADDGQQVIVATLGDLISAKRVVVGARSTQWLGQMSDTSLQQLSQDHIQGKREHGPKPEVQTGTHFEDRFGTGFKLNSKSETA